ncbi:hypothetical protein [Treponema sp. R6D11]
MKKAAVFILFLILASVVWGQTYTWTGGANSSAWNDSGNWTGGASPGNGNPSYTIIIPQTTNAPVFSGGTELECDVLTIQTGASLDMGTSNLTLDTLQNSGNLILAGSGSQAVTFKTTPSTVGGTVTYNAGGTDFAELTNFTNLVITNGTRTGVGDITVGGNFTLTGGSLTATSISVTGTSSINGNVTTSGNQTYTGNVTYSGARALNGTIKTLGTISGDGNPLTITGDGTLNGGSVIGALTVNGNFSLASGALNAASVSVTGTSTIAGTITTTGGTQTYGAVTLGGNVTLDGTTVTLGAITGNSRSLTITGDSVLNGSGSNIGALSVSATGSKTVTIGGDVTLDGTTVTLGNIAGGGNSLAITGDGVLNGGSGINTLSVSGTSTINADITTTGTQTYTGAVTLGGTRALTSTNGIVTLGTITGAIHALTINGNGTLNGGGIDALLVNGDFTLASGTLSAASVNVPTGTSNIAGNITTTGNQTYNGNVTFNGARTLTSSGASGIISITQTEDLSLGSLQTATTGSISIDATGAVTQTGTITTGTLTLSGPGSYVLKLANEVSTIETTGTAPASIEYTNNNNLLTLGLMTVPMVSTGTISINSKNDITVSDNITAYKLKLITTGEVIVTATGSIETTSTGNEDEDAAIYIEADDFNVLLAAPGSIVPGDKGVKWGQLCLVLNKKWADLDLYPSLTSVVDGPEDPEPDSLSLTGYRWHQHYIDLSKNLAYGNRDVLLALNLDPDFYEIVYDTSKKTSFPLTAPATKIEIYNAKNTSDLTFATTATGSIEFFGTNDFKNIALTAGSGGVILADADIKVTGGFVLSAGTGITLASNSPSGTGSSITAANITLNSITTADQKNLALTSKTGSITVNGAVGTSTNKLGDITVESAGNVTLSGVINANSIAVTSTTTTIGANIDTTGGTQTYSSTVTLGGNVEFIGTTVTLGTITGATHALIITGNGVLNGGGTGIGALSVSGDFNLASGTLSAASVAANTVTGTSIINGNITTTSGTQAYGAVTLGGSGTLILTSPAGTTITLGAITGANHALTINGNGVFNNGGIDIGALTVIGDFNLVSGNLSAVSVAATATTGTSTIAGNIMTTGGTQNYAGAVILDDAVTLAGTTVTMGNITGATNALTITGNGVFNNGGTNIGALTVSENFNLVSGTLSAASVAANTVTGISTIAGNITTTSGTQTYGAVTLGGAVTLNGTVVTLGMITGANHALTIDGDGVFNNGGTGIAALSVSDNFNLTGGTLNAASVAANTVTGTSNISGNITTSGDQTYTKAVTLSGSKRTIISNDGDISFSKTLNSQNIIELLAPKGNITVSGLLKAYQLIAKASSGTVSVDKIEIDSTNTGNNGINAAIFIEANTFAVTTATQDSIKPGGTGGQLCLVLNHHWDDISPPDSVVDGPEDNPNNLGTVPGARWHQHGFINLTGLDLVYGAVPSGLTDPYEHITASSVQTTFILDDDHHIYINDANNNDNSLVFKTSGLGSIKISGTNSFEKITLEAGSGGIHLFDTNITVIDDFELTEGITLETNSGTGSSIKAANITLTSISATNNENLTLTSLPGEINITGAVGNSTNRLGIITLDSANEVTLSGAIFANSIGVTSTGTIIGSNINTTGNQIYGAVTLDGTGATRTLTGTTVNIGTITGGGNALTVTGNGTLNGGGDGIGTLTVSGNFNLAGGVLNAVSVTANTVTGTSSIITTDITTTGAQTYGAVTLGGSGTRTLTGTTLTLGATTLGGNVELTGTPVTLGAITGATHALTITGNGSLNGGGSIGALTINNNFTLANAALSATSVNVTGTSNINADITTTGAQTYTGAVTLGGTGTRTITSQSGNIEFNSTLTSTGVIKLLAANIIISGSTSANQLIAKAPSGIVSVNAISINSSYAGNEGETAAIYIEANTFVVTTTTPNSIIPGRKTGAQWGQLCLNLSSNDIWTNPNGVVDGDKDTDPDNLHATGYRWHQHLPPVVVVGKILYSFTEDSNGDGKLDRIRVQTNKELDGFFGGLIVSVQGYAVEKIEMVNNSFDNDSFYIYLTEKSEFDGGNRPDWKIESNTSLNYKGSLPELVANLPAGKNPTIDTIPPRITYTLTLPMRSETYAQMSEPLASFTGTSVSFGVGAVTVSAAPSTNLGYLFSHSASYTVNVLAQLPNIYNDTASTAGNGYFQMSNVVDTEQEPNWAEVDPNFPPKYPLNWGYTAYAKVTNNTSNAQGANGTIPFANVFTPPNKLLTVDMMSKLASNQGASVTPSISAVTRRVTDVLVSLSSNNYFVLPTFAKPSDDNNSITEFDGSKYIEKESIEKSGIELQARINNNLTITPQLFWTTADIPANMRNPKEASDAKKTGGLWLPDVLTNPLYYYVPMSGGIKTALVTNVSPLFNYDISANDLANSGAKFEFIFRLSNTSDMFVARLDAPPNTIPSNWYTLVRPFGFNIQGIRYQRGGVTILNNVINSDNKETAIIRYDLPRAGKVTIQIYTLDGTLVKSIRRNESRDSGAHVDTWDGSNNGGRAVARGMYFVRVVGPDIDEIRKIMVVK